MIRSSLCKKIHRRESFGCPSGEESNSLRRDYKDCNAVARVELNGAKRCGLSRDGMALCQMQHTTTSGWQCHEVVDLDSEDDENSQKGKSMNGLVGSIKKFEYRKMIGKSEEEITHIRLSNSTNCKLSSCSKQIDADEKDSGSTLTPHVLYPFGYGANAPCVVNAHSSWQGARVPVGMAEYERWVDQHYCCGSSKIWSSCSSTTTLNQNLQNLTAHDLRYGMHELKQPGYSNCNQDYSFKDSIDATTQASGQQSLYLCRKTARKNLTNFFSTCFDKAGNVGNSSFHAESSCFDQEANVACHRPESQNKAFGRDSRDPIWTKFKEDFYLPFPIPIERIVSSIPAKRKRGRPPKAGSKVGTCRRQPAEKRKRKRRKKRKLLFSRTKRNVHACLQNLSRLVAKGCSGKLGNLLIASARGRKRKGQTCRDHPGAQPTATSSILNSAIGPSLEAGSSFDTGEFVDFGHKLEAICQAPFDMTQLVELIELVKNRKPVVRLRNTRQGSVFFSTEQEGLSYLDHHPDLAKKLESTANLEEKLRLLRGFFFWIQHSCMNGSFKPWTRMLHESEDDDCMEIECPDCEVLAVVLPIDEHQNIGSVLGRDRYQEFITIDEDGNSDNSGMMEEHSGISISSVVKVKLEDD